ATSYLVAPQEFANHTVDDVTKTIFALVQEFEAAKPELDKLQLQGLGENEIMKVVEFASTGKPMTIWDQSLQPAENTFNLQEMLQYLIDNNAMKNNYFSLLNQFFEDHYKTTALTISSKPHPDQGFAPADIYQPSNATTPIHGDLPQLSQD